MKILNKTPRDILIQIDKTFQEAYIAVRKKKSVEEVWNIWGDFMVEMKIELEQSIQKTNIPHIGYIYAYLQNKNQIINLNIETRVGKIGLKKDTIKSGSILRNLIHGLVETDPVDEINKKVADHLDQLYTGRKYDLIAGKKIFVDDYPEKDILQEPKKILAPEELTIKENKSNQC